MPWNSILHKSLKTKSLFLPNHIQIHKTPFFQLLSFIFLSFKLFSFELFRLKLLSFEIFKSLIWFIKTPCLHVKLVHVKSLKLPAMWPSANRSYGQILTKKAKIETYFSSVCASSYCKCFLPYNATIWAYSPNLLIICMIMELNRLKAFTQYGKGQLISKCLWSKWWHPKKTFWN